MASSSGRERRLYAIPGQATEDAATCDHASVRELGSDGGANRYLECPSCESVLVREGYLPERERSSDDLGTIDPRLDDLLDDIDAYHDGTGSSFAIQREPTAVSRFVDACRRLLR